MNHEQKLQLKSAFTSRTRQAAMQRGLKNAAIAAGAHPANFKEGVLKRNLIPHSGADPDNFGGGMKF